jgi:hypothetical protein
MHQRGTEVQEIGDTLYHKYHPSSVWIGDYMYVAAAYFEAEGIFHNNEHLTMNSRIVLLGSRDLGSWGEMEMAAGSGGHVHPIFKRNDESGLVELMWARMESEVSTSLMHGFFSKPTGFLTGPGSILKVRGIPNPFSSSSTIRLDLDSGQRVSVDIYDCAGRCVNRLAARRPMTAGAHDILWDGYDASGRKVAPGIYFVRVRSAVFDQSVKIVRIR